MRKLASAVLSAVLLASALPVISSSAEARGWYHEYSYHPHYVYRPRYYRPYVYRPHYVYRPYYSCWRTNRWGQHFRVC